MRQLLLFAILFFGSGLGICQGAGKSVTFFTAEELQAGITDHSLEFDFFLVDVRDDWELANGIIASRYCRPYHLSWAYNVLQDNYRLLPDTMRILLYCQTGNRALDAANFLADKGFALLGCLTGGVRVYDGELRDSTELKPLSLLPEPSYFRDTTAAIRSHRRFTIPSRTEGAGQSFTLQGRIIGQAAPERSAQSFVVVQDNGQGVFRCNLTGQPLLMRQVKR